MALTNKQTQGVIELFVRAFTETTNKNERRYILSTFEQAFGNSISEWKNQCKSIMEEKEIDKELIDEFDILTDRRKNSANAYEIRLLEEKDLSMVREIINHTFTMGLISHDDEKFKEFIEDGCSFVAL